MYPDFRRWALPKEHRMFGPRRLVVAVDEFYSGVFFLKGGHIRLSYGDHGSGCCEVVRVRRSNRTTLIARLETPYPYGDEGDPGAPVSASSTFSVDGKTHEDLTKRFRLPPPSG